MIAYLFIPNHCDAYFKYETYNKQAFFKGYTCKVIGTNTLG